MSLITFAQVFIVCLLGAMSPGPSMAVVINNAIFKGRYNGIITSIGHGIGIAVYATFAVLGLGLIIKTNIFISMLNAILFLFQGKPLQVGYFFSGRMKNKINEIHNNYD